MLNNNKFTAIAIVAFGLCLGGCSGHEGVKDTGAGVPTSAPSSSLSSSPYGNGGGSTQQQGSGNLSAHSVYFDFDRSDIKPEGQTVISNWSGYMKGSPSSKVRLEGNCDERGTREYNIGLGERRANAVASSMESQGVSASQLSIVSYGKERPVATGHDEDSWAQNRRVDLVQQ